MTTLTRLWELAGEQHGFVTTQDAEGYGIPATTLVKAAARGRLWRVAHGVYRFPEFPETELDPYALATLWAAQRGVLSHETALQLHDLCDVEPEKIHLTVPRHCRIRRQGGDAYVIHHQDLVPEDLAWFEGIRIVTAERAIRQAIATAVAPHLVGQSIETARRRGRIPRDLAAELDRLLHHVDA